jgi:preprotein translocase subunit SecD
MPNFFGEIPAVQISSANSIVQIDQELLLNVENNLKQQRIPYLGIISDASGIKIKLPNTDIQLKVKDELQHILGNNYMIALNLLSSSPDWLSNIGAFPMYLGLDLRGGVHFLMQIDMMTAINKQLDRQINEVRSLLRNAQIPLGGVNHDGQTLIVKFRNDKICSLGMEELRKKLHEMTCVQLDETRIALTLTPESIKKFQNTTLQQNVLTLKNRINELGVAEPIIQQQGIDRVVVQLPGVQDTAKAKDIIGRTASLEIHMVDEEHADQQSLQNAARGLIPPGDEFYLSGRDNNPILVKKAIVLTGENISNASAGFDSHNNEPAVNINLDVRGARIFSQVTRDNIGKRMAILLIEKGNGEVVTAPVIRQQIDGGRVQITGHMTVKEANDVALLLRSGALAAPMNIIEERTIGPSLGLENIAKGVHSVLWGFVTIAVFMSIYYRIVGIFSTLALAANVLLLIAMLSLIQATLTLPGIAAIALTVGMAIDANVLINERIREELRSGCTFHASIHAGYEHAFGTILDTNVTSFIAGAALFAYGTGPVRGFAVVLCLGILTSMFSAILVSRAMINLTYGRQRKITSLSI